METNQLFLQHHGILGQKWGVRNGSNYPLKPSQHSSSEKKHLSGKRGASLAKYKAKRAAKAEIATIKQAEKNAKIEAKKNTEREKQKAKILKSRSISKVYKNAQLFSDDELVQLRNRFQLEYDIRKLKNSNITQKGRDTIEKMNVLSDGLNKVANTIENGSKVYNNVAKVMNSLYGSDLKIIGEKKEPHRKETEYTTTTKTKDKSGNDVTIVKKWKE